MNVRTRSYTSVPAAAVFAGLTLVLVACALPSPAANDQKPRLSNNGTAICPNGWIPAATSKNDLNGQNLCVRVQEQMLTWTRARQDCRASKGFLIKLDSILNVDNLQLNEYLKSRGLDSVWTGMHHEHGTLMWDELQPRMVKAYYGKTQAAGWKKRDWEFNFDSFKLKSDTCGQFEVHEEDSSEIVNDQASNRTRRSPQQPVDSRGAQRLRGVLHKRQRTGLDNEEVAPSRSPIEEKVMDTSQSSLSQGLQEGFSDNGGDISNAGDTNSAGNADPSNGPQIPLGRTTVRSITATDQSNVEEVDELLATKRSSRRPTTNDKVTNATTISGNSSMSRKNTTQGNATSSPLPMKSSRTTSNPRSSTSVDDLLKRLLKSSLDSSPNSDVSGSVDTSSNSDRLDPTLTPGKDTVDPPVVESVPNTDSQSGNRDTSDDMTSGNPSLNNSVSIDLTDTSDPLNTDTNNDLIINATSFSTTTASINSATQTANSVRNRYHPKNKISGKTIAATSKFVTHMPTANRTVSSPNNAFPNSSVMPTLFPTTTSNGSLTTDSHNMNNSPTTRLARKRVKGFPGNRRSKPPTRKWPIHAMTTPRLSPAAGVAAEAETAKTTTTATAITTTTTTTATTRNIPIMTTVDIPTSAVAASTRNIPIMTKVDIPTSTVAATTRNIPLMTTVDIPTSTVAASTRNIPIMTTVDIPSSTVAASTRNIPTTTTVNIPTSTVAASTRNIPTTTTVDIPTSTVAASTRNIPTTTTVDIPTSTVAATTRNIPTTTTVDIPTSTVAASTRNIPTTTTVDIPTSTVAASTRNIPTTTTVNIPTSTVAATTRNIPIMTTVDIPTSTVAATTRNIPTTTTVNIPTSTVAATTRNIPTTTTVNIPTSTVAATTRNIPIMTTVDIPTSTVAASTRNIPTTTTVDIPTSTVAASTRNIPTTTTVNIPTSTVAATTRNIPIMTTVDIPTSTVAATTRNIPTTTTVNIPTSTVAASTRNIPTMAAVDIPTSAIAATTNDNKLSTTNIPIMTTGMRISTVATNHLPTSAGNKYLDSRQSIPIKPEPLIGKVLLELPTTTKVPVMTTTPDLPMSVIANTTSLTTFTANENLFTKPSVLHDFESSSSKLPSIGPKATTNSPATTETHLQMPDVATITTINTTARATSTADQDIMTSKFTPQLSNPPTGKNVSKRSTTKIPIMTTTDLPTSTMPTTTTTSRTSFASQPNLTTSSDVTASAGAQNSAIMNTSNTSLSAVAPNNQTTTETPVVIATAKNTPAAALVTTKATSQVDNTTTSISGSRLQLTDTPVPPNTTITNTPPLITGIINNTGPTLNPKTPGTDDSSEITDHTDPPHHNSTRSIPGIGTTPDITDPNSKEADLDSAITSTETSSSVDLDAKHSLNTTGNNNFLNTGLDSSSPTRPEASDKATSVSRISNHALSNPSAIEDRLKSTTGKSGFEKADTIKDNKANSQRDSAVTESQGSSDELGGNSSSTDEPTKDTSFHVPVDLVSLSHCEEEHASVCVTEAVEELSLVGHCDRNWYGHRLLDRCYKPVDYMLKAIEARQNCLRYSATLATVDTGFYGNVTALLLNYFAPGSRAWVDASLNLEVPDVGQCAALEDGQLRSVDCNLRLPSICQKDVRFSAPSFEDGIDARGPMLYVQNLTSFHPQTLWCPLRMSAFDDVILWFKDGRPIVDPDDDDALSFRPANGHMPNRLDIDLSILEHLGDGGARIPKPAMLQGLYWCEIFRREPFKRVVSYKIFLKFTDVITLYGHVTTKPVNHVTAAIFNRMGHVIGLPALLERRLATLNKNITHFMRRVFPIVRDIITFIQRTNPDTGRSEFTTYICLATGDLGSRIRGSLVDLYISAFYDALAHAEDELHEEWNLTLPIRQAVALTMADMCPEANLVDRSTGLSATFPSTAVNDFAASRDICNGAPTGSAFCKGDLQSGAYWDTWQVTNPCHNFVQQPLPNKPGRVGTHTPLGPHTLDETNGNRANVGGEVGAEKPAKPDLVELNHLPVNKDNLVDVSDRLADVINHAGDLSALDIETIAEVVHRIVSVDKLTSEISDKLVKTANFVLDASEGELRKAEQSSNAPSR